MKDTLCAYYTNSNDITSYMTAKIHIKPTDIILEPSVGEGIFVDSILKQCDCVQIDALDINKEIIALLQKKYKENSSIEVRKTNTLLTRQLDNNGMSPQIQLKLTDTLLDEQLNHFSMMGGYYTKIIGNPPYGAWQEYEKRDILKKKYPGQYVKETYSLFLLRCISVLRMHGRLSFIIPDTYLFLNMHSRLRKIILMNTKIEEILIFPSKFFPGVSFGYSNLSIITLERCEQSEALKNEINIIQGFHSSDEFKYIISNTEDLPNYLHIYKLKQCDIYSNLQHRFVIAEQSISKLIKKCEYTLGDIANVVTGLYTGDNLRFIKAKNKNVKGANKYDVVKNAQIYPCTSISGISDVEEGYIPYIKSASKTKYNRGIDEWFVRWDKETIKFYNRNKKSRFQNSSFYFKTGIGIPMVKSNTIRAFLMQNKVFDQSIVGIFPKDQHKIYYLLALMNSDIINKLIHIINPTANNSANYVKQLPYYEPDLNTINVINQKVREIIEKLNNYHIVEANNIHDEVNSIINSIYDRNVNQIK